VTGDDDPVDLRRVDACHGRYLAVGHPGPMAGDDKAVPFDLDGGPPGDGGPMGVGHGGERLG
jgi:hypothetical protein